MAAPKDEHSQKAPRQQLLQLISSRTHRVAPTRHLEVTPDPDDNLFLKCAHARPSHYLGRNQRQSPKLWKKTKVITRPVEPALSLSTHSTHLCGIQ
jgi:hypothetical protein